MSKHILEFTGGFNFMSEPIIGEHLVALVSEGEIIKDGNVSNCKGLKYDLVLSKRFLKAKFGTPTDYSSLNASDLENESAVVAPGEVVFVLTEETLNLPLNYYAQLSPKRNMSELGINVNGALFVDPGYHGKLVFGLYNFSSTNFPLIPGKTFASIMLHKLTENEAVTYPNGKMPKPITDFSTELINMISKCSPIGITALSKTVEQINEELFSLKKNMYDNDRWAKEVKGILDDLSEENKTASKNISDLSRGLGSLKESLQDEIRTRQKSDDEISRKIDKKVIVLQTLGGFISTVIIGGGGALFIAWLTGFLKF